MTLLDNHLEQIALSAKSIGDLEFPPPKIFTNALLGSHEITTLIRDTEPHERALFSIDPSATSGVTSGTSRNNAPFGSTVHDRRKTGQDVQHRQSSAVAKVLGSDMLRQIQQSSRIRGRRGVNVKVLLQGAERLCAVYSVPGASDRISTLRDRHARITRSIAEYEARVIKQQTRLNGSNGAFDTGEHSDEDGDAGDTSTVADERPAFTEETLQYHEEEIRELEARKKALEERVAGMERDLGGLLR